MVVGLLPFGVVLSLATGTGMLGSVCVTLLLGLMVAIPNRHVLRPDWLVANTKLNHRQPPDGPRVVGAVGGYLSRLVHRHGVGVRVVGLTASDFSDGILLASVRSLVG